VHKLCASCSLKRRRDAGRGFRRLAEQQALLSSSGGVLNQRILARQETCHFDAVSQRVAICHRVAQRATPLAASSRSKLARPFGGRDFLSPSRPARVCHASCAVHSCSPRCCWSSQVSGEPQHCSSPAMLRSALRRLVLHAPQQQAARCIPQVRCCPASSVPVLFEGGACVLWRRKTCGTAGPRAC
jgi:hypothetical protein